MRRTLVLFALLPFVPSLSSQDPPLAQNQQQVIDPVALDVLKAVLDPIRQAGAYSFTARIAEERLGTNGQLITRFREGTTTVAQPDRVRIDFIRDGRPLQFIFNRGRSVLYSPQRNLYAEAASPATIDAALQSLEQRDIAFPTSNLLRSDPYQSLAPDLTGAYVVGRTVLNGVTVHQLAFTEPGATWQLFVEGGPNPRAKRLEIVYTDQPGSPRTTIEFDKWQFRPNINPAMFAFAPPPDALQVPLLVQPQEGD